MGGARLSPSTGRCGFYGEQRQRLLPSLLNTNVFLALLGAKLGLGYAISCTASVSYMVPKRKLLY